MDNVIDFEISKKQVEALEERQRMLELSLALDDVQGVLQYDKPIEIQILEAIQTGLDGTFFKFFGKDYYQSPVFEKDLLEKNKNVSKLIEVLHLKCCDILNTDIFVNSIKRFFEIKLEKKKISESSKKTFVASVVCGVDKAGEYEMVAHILQSNQAQVITKPLDNTHFSTPRCLVPTTGFWDACVASDDLDVLNKKFNTLVQKIDEELSVKITAINYNNWLHKTKANYNTRHKTNWRTDEYDSQVRDCFYEAIKDFCDKHFLPTPTL
jgi:hypothetical protein